MPMPVKVIMDDLNFIADTLKESGRYGEALSIHTLEDAANAAGHQVYTWDGVVERVRGVIPAVQASSSPLGEDVLELVDAALSKPRGVV